MGKFTIQWDQWVSRKIGHLRLKFISRMAWTFEYIAMRKDASFHMLNRAQAIYKSLQIIFELPKKYMVNPKIIESFLTMLVTTMSLIRDHNVIGQGNLLKLDPGWRSWRPRLPLSLWISGFFSVFFFRMLLKQMVVNWWFGARWCVFLGSPYYYYTSLKIFLVLNGSGLFTYKTGWCRD